MANFKFAVIQLNPIVGDLIGNYEKHILNINEAASSGADMVVFPEMSITGYPLEDLVLRQSFVDEVKATVDKLVNWIHANHPNIGVIFGAPRSVWGSVYNEAVYCFNGSTEYRQKYELPNYGVFDEKRVFARGHTPLPIEFRGHKIGLMICEDGWYPYVSRTLVDKGAEMLLSINGSPFEIGKNVTRRNIVANRIKETNRPYMYVNLVGGQDELVFDGGSFFYDGTKIHEANHFQEEMVIWNVKFNSTEPIDIASFPSEKPSGIKELYQAIHLGTKDYITKQKKWNGEPLFKSVVLGYSGGVDSGIVAAIACDALGAENVHLVRLPSVFSSNGSLTDAADGAMRLGAKMRTIDIEPVVDALRTAYWGAIIGCNFYDYNRSELTGLADENIQARARGNILMSISNQEGHLLLTTGNKSEVSVGYSTLYGDMSGGYNPIKDAYKTTVWELCRWRNSLSQQELDELGFKGRVGDVVPESIISKPPSAELRPDQKDEDSLPPYPVLDAILKGMIEDEKSVSDLEKENVATRDVLVKIRNLIDNSEYKRRQSAPGVKLTSKIHGRDRRYPIVNAWRG